MNINSHLIDLALEQDLQKFSLSLDQTTGLPTAKAFASNALLKGFFKKFEDLSSAPADEVAYLKFVTTNERVAGVKIEPTTMLEEYLLGHFDQAMERFWHPNNESHLLVSSFSQLFLNGNTGPGAALEARGEDFYTKLFDSPLSVSSKDLATDYIRQVRLNPTWTEATFNTCKVHGPAVLVQGNKLSFAPKNADVSRVIAVEPSINMFLQLGLGDVIANRVKQCFGIDIPIQQDKNRDLARLGSLTGEYSTIDLSSASDSISKALVDAYIPKDQNWLLYYLRSETMDVSAIRPGHRLQLNMISTMGNGFTFSLMTSIFCCAIVAAYEVADIPLQLPRGKSPGNFAVYGDDIIVRKDVARHVLTLLKILGFQVNASKTFLEGPFRESCGADFYLGAWVRPVFCKTLRTPESRYHLINSLIEWSALTDIPVRNTVRLLLKTVPREFVPEYNPTDSGIRATELIAHPKVSSNGRLMFSELEPDKVQLTVAQDVQSDGLTAETKLILQRKGYKHRNVNIAGLLCAILRGDMDDNHFFLRQKEVRTYVRRQRLTHNWSVIADYVDGTVSYTSRHTGKYVSSSRGSWERSLLGNIFEPLNS